ncbi:MAG: NUDIX domain-containing protein [Akkermansia sp.]|nr:NUDIX domain-containing protein [Akkermansia sp.]
MSRYNGEQVLVVPREAFEAIGAFNGVRLNPQDYLTAFLKPGVARYMDRDIAEESPQFKQIIAYAIFCCNGKVLAYARTKKGGETRLHDKMSLGIGGHINPIDGLAENLSTYLAGVEREIREEISFSGTATQQLYAVINDDTNEVGSVHLGIVHRFELDSEEVIPLEKKLTDLRFCSLEELAGPLYERLETWSAICVDALRQA